MRFEIDFLFKAGSGYDELVQLIGSNYRYVFEISKQDKIDKRTTKSKETGWTDVTHKRHAGVVKLKKNNGVCTAEIKDDSGGHQLIGSWTSWIASNASHMVSGMNLRFRSV
jgi:hypothetical protein